MLGNSREVIGVVIHIVTVAHLIGPANGLGGHELSRDSPA